MITMEKYSQNKRILRRYCRYLYNNKFKITSVEYLMTINNKIKNCFRPFKLDEYEVFFYNNRHFTSISSKRQITMFTRC